MLDPRHRQEAVAEVRLGRRARADPRPGGGEQVELVPVGVRRVHDRGAGRQAAFAVEQLDRPERRARPGIPRSRAPARRRGCGAAARARRRSGRAPPGPAPGRRGRSGGRRRRGFPRPAASRARAGTPPPSPAGTAPTRRAGSRRRGRRTRSRPPQPLRPRPEPRRARGSGTRRPRCTRRCAARGRPRCTRCGSRRRSPTRRGRSSRRATPRSRRPARSPRSARWNAWECASTNPGSTRVRGTRRSYHHPVSFPEDGVPHSLCAAGAAAERAHDRPPGPDPGLCRADPDVRQRTLVGGRARVRRRGRDRPDRRLPGPALARRVGVRQDRRPARRPPDDRSRRDPDLACGPAALGGPRDSAPGHRRARRHADRDSPRLRLPGEHDGEGRDLAALPERGLRDGDASGSAVAALDLLGRLRPRGHLAARLRRRRSDAR